jgi:ATP-dependent DNA helicase PIF1
MKNQTVLPHRSTSQSNKENERLRALSQECKRKKRKLESAEERENRLRKERELKRQRRMSRDFGDADERLNHPNHQESPVIVEHQLPKPDRDLLQNFRTKINKLSNKFCSSCKEFFPSIELRKGECYRCYYDKDLIKKFSKENNMDPGDVPEELQGLTQIEEILIAQIFPVISVYCLRGGQYAYRGNVINFPQDVLEFATRLPRCPSSLDILVVRRRSANNLAFRDFNVRRDKVFRALHWLKANNRYYAEIVIDNEILQSLPNNGPIDDQLPQLEDVEGEYFNNIDDETETEDIIASNFVPAPLPSPNEECAIGDALSRMQTDNTPIMWPSIDGNPINEFRTPGYIARAFPTLYPTGDADLRSEHIREIKPAEYFSHLLKYKDGRFARHTRWRYFALNSQMRWRALQEGKVYVKQSLNGEQLTVEDVQEMVDSDSHMADKVVRFGESLRGTRQFWNKRRFELTDMVKQLGSQGMIFFTFSAADLHWPELHKLMPRGEHSRNPITEPEISKQRRQNLIDNPHIAAWFFEKRFKLFLEKVLIPKWKLEDWWYRFEWQHRGSTHVHGIGKVQGAPIIDWEKMKENEEIMSNVVQYIDSLVTTINPGLDAPVPNRHPCQKRHNEMNDDLLDYVELVNKLQRHTRCSPSYCLRVNKKGQQLCRFNYPKENAENTYLRDNNGQPELITARNDPYINPHNRLQLQGWRANVDLKPILDVKTALQYICKYASKSEPRSAAFSEILNKILNNSRPSDSSLGIFQKLLLSTIAERDISAQETCHLLLGIPLYHSSRRFITLNLNKEAPRWLRGTGNETGFSENNEVGRTIQSPLQKYWNRPVELEDLSLFRLYLRYYFWNGQWKQSKRENIVRIWPRPLPQRNGPQWEEFCRVKVLLHVCHRDLNQLTENDSASWTELFDRHYAEIENEADLLGPPVDNLENDHDNEESDDEQEDDEHEREIRLEWMILSEMGPNAVIMSSSDLGLRDIDRNYDWIGDFIRRHPDLNSADMANFIQQSRTLGTIDEENLLSNCFVDSHTLNEKQMTILKQIESHYNALIANPSQVEPLRLIIMGTAGTGKSHLIKTVRNRLQEMAKVYSINTQSPVLVLAPTGVAAFNIRGVTIHSALSIPIGSNNFDIDGERLKQLQKRLGGVNYLIIDEKSMVGRRMLALIDMRLRQAFPEHKNQPFGNCSIIIVGDFGQLPPVLDEPMYSQTSRRDQLSNDGIFAYKQFREVYKLDIVQRQSGDSEEQRNFRDILLRMRDGESTADDWKVLATRFIDSPIILSQEKEQFSDATYLFPRKADVNEFNIDKLKSLNCPIARIDAIHTGGNEARRADSDIAKGLEARLLLARGARVMLRSNLWTEAGLVNGSMGIVQEIVFEENQGPPSLPIAVLIEFDNYTGPAIMTAEGKRLVPIPPSRQIWEGTKGICSRMQVPVILAWSITVHKSQGLTLQKAVIDLGKKEYAAGISFVAISRVRALRSILFRPFSLDRLQRIKNCKRLRERLAEERRLSSMIPQIEPM